MREMVRDYALAASGLLAPTIGGPSVKPYQPKGIWETVAMEDSNTRFYKQDHGDKLYRRSLYTFWKRSAPPASMDIFNAPTRENCTVRRERTNTPLQALVTMNDPQFVEAARQPGAAGAARGAQRFRSRLDFMTVRLLARPLDSRERDIVKSALIGIYRPTTTAHPADAAKLLCGRRIQTRSCRCPRRSSPPDHAGKPDAEPRRGSAQMNGPCIRPMKLF